MENMDYKAAYEILNMAYNKAIQELDNAHAAMMVAISGLRAA